jgi:hypothetical protein
MAQLQIQTPKGDIVFLGALPLNALPRRVLNLSIMPVTLRDLVVWVDRRISEGYRLTHYIRHVGTIAALRALGIPLDERPNIDLYKYKEGDILVIVSLKTPPRGQDVIEVAPQDLEVWLVHIS